MMVDSELLVYVVAEGIGMKEFHCGLDGFELVDPNYWHMSFDAVVHAFCVCISSKVKIFCSLSANLEVHMFDCGISDYCPSGVHL